MEVVITQAASGQAVEGRRGDGPAERAGRAEAEVVDQNHDHVGRALRGRDLEARWRLRVARVGRGDCRMHGRRHREDGAVGFAGGGETGREHAEPEDEGCCGWFHGSDVVKRARQRAILACSLRMRFTSAMACGFWWALWPEGTMSSLAAVAMWLLQ